MTTEYKYLATKEAEQMNELMAKYISKAMRKIARDMNMSESSIALYMIYSLAREFGRMHPEAVAEWMELIAIIIRDVRHNTDLTPEQEKELQPVLDKLNFTQKEILDMVSLAQSEVSGSG